MIARAPALADARSAPVVIPRAALSSVAEDGSAACANAADAIARAIEVILADQPLAAIHFLKRAGFELQELRPNLNRLALIADASSAA